MNFNVTAAALEGHGDHVQGSNENPRLARQYVGKIVIGAPDHIPPRGQSKWPRRLALLNLLGMRLSKVCFSSRSPHGSCLGQHHVRRCVIVIRLSHSAQCPHVQHVPLFLAWRFPHNSAKERLLPRRCNLKSRRREEPVRNVWGFHIGTNLKVYINVQVAITQNATVVVRRSLKVIWNT